MCHDSGPDITLPIFQIASKMRLISVIAILKIDAALFVDLTVLERLSRILKCRFVVDIALSDDINGGF